MALLGSSVDPRLFMQDYSGFTRAAEIQAQGMQNLGAAIGQGIKDFGEARQERKKLDAQIKADSASIDSAIKLGDSLGIDIKSYLAPIQEKINDPNTTPMEAAAYGRAAAQGISNAFTLGIGAQERQASQLMQQQRLGLEQQYKAAQLGMRAEELGLQRQKAAMEAGAIKSEEVPVVNAITGEKDSVLINKDAQGRMRDPESGKVIKDLFKYGNQMEGWEAPDEAAMPTPTSQIAPSGQIKQSALSSPLRQYAGSFEEYGNKYGVDPALLAAIAEHETGGGKSSAFRNKNNAMGVSNASGPIKMASVEASIEKMASLLGRGINEGKGPYANAKSIEDIGRRYAPIGAGNDPRNLNQFWTRGVKSKYEKLAAPQQIDNAVSMSPTAIGTPQQQAEVARMIEEGQGMAMAQNMPQGAMPTEPSMATQQPQLPQQAAPPVNRRLLSSRQGKAAPVVMTAEQVKDLEGQGFKVSAMPTPEGTFMVSGVTTGGSSKGIEVKTADGTIITYGGSSGLAQPKVGAGQQLIPDPTSPTGTRVVDVPGGEAEKAAKQEASAAETEKEKAIQDGAVLISDIDRFIDYTGRMSKLPFASPVRKAFAAIGMEEQAEAENMLKSVKSVLKFKTLAELRKASPTGSTGLGQVTQNEFDATADAWGALSIVGNPDIQRERAIAVKTRMLDLIHGNQKHRDALLKSGAISQQQYNEIQSQYPSAKQVSQEDAKIQSWRNTFTPQPTQ